MQKTTKTFALILSLAMVALIGVSPIGIFRDCPWVNRCCYHFFHAGWMHLLVNLWCFLSLVFIHKVNLPLIAGAFIIASCVPTCILVSTPTVGLSAICFTLLGITAYRYRLYSSLWVLGMILLGLFFPSINWQIHLYCWIAGLIVSLFYFPLPCTHSKM